jgi:hypothetical protein
MTLDERVSELEGITSRLRHGAAAIASQQEQFATVLKREQQRIAALEATVTQLREELARQAVVEELARLALEQDLDRVRLTADATAAVAGEAMYKAANHYHYASDIR